MFLAKKIFYLFLFTVLGELAPSTLFASTENHPVDLGTVLPAWSGLPFVGILLSIALCPLVTPKFWHHHFRKVAIGWALAFAIPFLIKYHENALHEILHTALIDYIPFIILLATLFTIGGGIFLRGKLDGSPRINLILLIVGTLFASWIGTTGSTMLFIRPLLRANRHRHHKTHTLIFFIFLVANVGGCLTPLGDPPLFLGFLHGVPFFWTLSLWKEMLFVSISLLILYFLMDTYFWKKEEAIVREVYDKHHETLAVQGWHNLFLLAGTLAAVILSGVWHLGSVKILGVEQTIENCLRDGFLILMLTLSWLTTPHSIREGNEFSWGPIKEVAILFIGIFITIIPVLAILRVGEEGSMASVIHIVKGPAHFFWASGILSSFLDNAPTYLTFLSTALGRLYPSLSEHSAIIKLITENPTYLQAIALGSVFMGANTYIGNAPNFMVKSIAESSGVKMPSFFGYIFRYSLLILIPIFLLTTWIFF
ncbi:MAG: sodium:proton antiporter [Chlamydiae bacterium]|nr:sodium:proton antiporter [Chlamydiota bacterium]MBI3276847.1 sodium:proton antiporter [Chlamydiota bacterium]